MKRSKRSWRNLVPPTLLGLSILLAGCGGGTKTEIEIANNNVPVAKIAAIDVLLPNTLANLKGEDSFDADGDPLTYTWSVSQKPAASTAAIADTTAKNSSLTPDTVGDYEVTLVVNDGKSSSQPTKLPIKVREVGTNVKPIADAGNSLTLLKGTAVNLDGSRSTDAEGSTLQYTWSFLTKPASSQAQLNNASAVAASFTPDVAGEYKVALVVNDGVTDSAIDVVVVSAKDSIVVSPGPNNNVPVAKIAAINVLAPNTLAALNGEESIDFDGDPLTYAWSISQKPTTSTASIADATAKNSSIRPDVTGDYEVTLIVNDGKIPSQPTRLAIKVRSTVTNAKPIANAGNSMNLVKGATVNLDGSRSTDAEGATLHYTWSFLSKPASSQSQLTNAAAVAASFTPDVAGEYKVALLVNDGVADSAIDVALVTAKEPTTPLPNKIPVAEAGENQVIKLGYTTYLDGAGSSDPDRNPLTFAWTMVDGPGNPFISDSTLIRPSIRPDIGGVYKFNLTVNDGIVDSLADTVTIITTEGRSEIEPNNASTTAQTMVDIGLNSPVAASINTSTDIDWFRFSVEKDQTYVIELFNVSDAFRDAVGTKCGASSNGLYAKLVDQVGTAITSKCTPIGSGNMHTFLEFKANYKGPYLLQVAANSTAIGNYNVRVLPSSGAKASWDPVTFEPNNSLYAAYKLDLGHTNAKTAKLEESEAAYTTNRTDVDWYRITATAGQTYVVELFDVVFGREQVYGRGCQNSDLYGLSLRVFNVTAKELKAQCDPVGSGNVYNILQFTAIEAGDYYVQVASNALNGNDGTTYSIRVLPKHNDPAATWDTTTFEPNNFRVNAYEIRLGYGNSLTSTLEARSETVTTNQADVDWYRFTAKAGQTYVVELFDVALGKLQSYGRSCQNSDLYGFSLRVFNDVGSELKAQCDPIGSGNVYNSVELVVPTDGVYYINVASNAGAGFNSGSYSLRLLPKHNDTAAAWDPVTFEPNNTLSTAYEIKLGQANALTSKLQRSVIVATNRADVDWYRFTATAKQIYVIELFDVSTGLLLPYGRGCENGDRYGLSLRAFDADSVEQKKQCTPVGSGNVHNTLEFTAPTAGEYYIQVALNAYDSTAQGNYSIKITPK